MKDFLGNDVEIDDTVLLALRSGRYAQLGRGFVKNAEVKPQFRGGVPTNMLEVEWSNIHRFWIPASKVVKLPDDMLPEKRREKLNETEEAIQPS